MSLASLSVLNTASETYHFTRSRLASFVSAHLSDAMPAYGGAADNVHVSPEKMYRLTS